MRRSFLRISVIVSVYNTEKYLKECFNSLVNQTYKDIEIIAVNDGSNDNSPEILNEFAKKYKNIKIINQKNKGYSEARNVALKEATGDYIGFVDSDDYIAPDMFEKLMNTAKNKKSDIVSCSFFRFYQDGSKVLDSNELFFNVLEEKRNTHSLLNYPELLLDHGFVWNRIYKTELLKENNIIFPKDIEFGEDTYFHRLALIKAKNIEYIKDSLYFYRQGRKGAQTTLVDKRNLSFIKNCEKLYQHIDIELYPYMNHLCLSLCSLGYERIEKKYKDEYYENFINLIKSAPKPFKIAFPSYKNCSFIVKARYIVLKILHPLLYFSLDNNCRILFDFTINSRIFFQKLPAVIKSVLKRK